MAKKEVVEIKYPEATIHDFSVIIKPVITEKSMQLMQNEGKFTMRVAKTANALEIKQAFESIFNKKVEKVNILNVRARNKRVGRYECVVGGWKKAIIKLAPGETLDLFNQE